MWEDLEVVLEKVKADNLKEKPSPDDLGFGKHFTDHMFLMKWDREMAGMTVRFVHIKILKWTRLQWFFIMVKLFLKALKHTGAKTIRFSCFDRKIILNV